MRESSESLGMNQEESTARTGTPASNPRFTNEQLVALRDFEREMEDVVIPEIVRRIRERERLAAERRDLPLYGRAGE